MDHTEKIGYIAAKVETIEADIAEIKRHIQTVSDQMSLYNTVMKGIKFIGVLLVGILTFKFGDLLDYWRT